MPKDQYGRPGPSMNPRPAPGPRFNQLPGVATLPTGAAFPGQGNAYGLQKPEVSTEFTPPPQLTSAVDRAKAAVPQSYGGPAALPPSFGPSFGGPAPSPVFSGFQPGARFGDLVGATNSGVYGKQGK